MIDPRSPCLIGVAQHTVHPGVGPAPEPLAMWERVCRAAADDTGAGQRVLEEAGSVQIVYCQSWPYDDPAGRLAERLGITPPHRFYSGIGGTTPQVPVQGAPPARLDASYDVPVIPPARPHQTGLPP